MSEEHESVGSVAEEATKLLGALQDWAQEGAGEAAGRVLHDLNEHIATGDADCRYCPVCQLIRGVRETSQEVRQHMASAATSLLHAATGVLEAYAQRAPSDGDRARDSRRTGVEKIDLADDGSGWEE